VWLNDGLSYRFPVSRYKDEDQHHNDEKEQNGTDDASNGRHRLKRVYNTNHNAARLSSSAELIFYLRATLSWRGICCRRVSVRPSPRLRVVLGSILCDPIQPNPSAD